MTANSARGEAEVAGFVLRPSFAALVAAEDERAAGGELKLSEMVALFWHCLIDKGAVARDDFADAVILCGLAEATPALKILLGQILGGQ
jgi:Phage tail tube protein, GTA-gp10